MPHGFDALKIKGFDHLEFAVADLDRAAEFYLRMGFKREAAREILERKARSYLLAQENVFIVLSQSSLPSDPIARFVAEHGDGLFNVAFLCEDAVSALEISVKRGGSPGEPPKASKRDFGTVQEATLLTPGDFRHTFLSREGSLFGPGFDVPMRSQRGFGLTRISHLALGVPAGEVETWSRFYENVFGLVVARRTDLHTGRTGMRGVWLRDPGEIVKIGILEPTEDASQVREFIDVHHGAGVRYVGLASSSLVETVGVMRREGVELRETGDRAQAFTHGAAGVFFYELAQSDGTASPSEVGERALFESLEREQQARGGHP